MAPGEEAHDSPKANERARAYELVASSGGAKLLSTLMGIPTFNVPESSAAGAAGALEQVGIPRDLEAAQQVLSAQHPDDSRL